MEQHYIAHWRLTDVLQLFSCLGADHMHYVLQSVLLVSVLFVKLRNVEIQLTIRQSINQSINQSCFLE